MSVTTLVADLKKLVTVNNELYNQSLNNKLQKSSAQIKLQEVYKPLLKKQEEQIEGLESIRATQGTTNEVLKKQHDELLNVKNIENKNNQKHAEKMAFIKPLVESVKNYPNLHKLLLGENINPQILTSDEQYILKHLNELDTQMLDILLKSVKNEEYLTKEGYTDSGIGRSELGTIPEEPEQRYSSNDEQRRTSEEVKKEIEEFNTAGKNIFTGITSKSAETLVRDDPNAMKTYLNTPSTIKDITNLDVLYHYLVVNKSIDIDKRYYPWKHFKDIDNTFIDRVRVERGETTGYGLCKCKRRSELVSKGKGVRFLPSDPNKLVKRLNILLAEKEAGNNNVFEEVSAIADELRRLGLMNIFQLKKLSKWVNK